MAILEIDEARKTYDDVVALDGVSLAVDGEILGLLGANGAGKSTLLRAVLDLVRLDAGQVRVGGHDVVREPLLARRQVGYLPEDLTLDDRLTGRETLAYVAGLRGRGDAAERDALLVELGLADKADELVGEYSFGMRKKLGLAIAFLGRPPLLLLDEPLNGLDTAAMRDLRLRFAALAAEGTTLVVSSHVMSFVERVCDRVAILRCGRVVAQGSPAALTRAAQMDGAPFEDVFLRYALGEDEAGTVVG